MPHIPGLTTEELVMVGGKAHTVTAHETRETPHGLTIHTFGTACGHTGESVGRLAQGHPWIDRYHVMASQWCDACLPGARQSATASLNSIRKR